MSRSPWFAADGPNVAGMIVAGAIVVAPLVGAQAADAGQHPQGVRLQELANQIAAGDASLEKFDLDAALTAYRQAHEIDPQNYEATWKLSRAIADKGTLAKDRFEQKKLYVEAEQL